MGPRQKMLGVPLRSLFNRQLLGVRVTLGKMCAWPGGIVFGIVDRLDRVRFAGVPFAPAGGFDARVHFGIQKNDRRVRAPGAAQPDVVDPGFRRQLAMVEDVAAVLLGIVLALRRDVAALLAI